MGGPSGTVTFLFTDIEGSTRLWEDSPSAMRDALERHDDIVQSAIAEHDGYLFSTGGDGFAAAFSRAGDAVAASARAQAALGREHWPEQAQLRVRMAVHTGEVVERGGNYFGTPVNQTARLMAVAHGGQVLCSAVTAELVRAEVALVDLGMHRLRDLSAPQRIFQVGTTAFPSLETVDKVPTNLPTVRSELIGRSAEVAAVTTLLEQHRLVTLTGVGGVGKTRLAIGVAAAVAPQFVDGCWLVELAPLNDGAEVANAVAVALGAPVPEQAALVRYLSDRRLLLVLDNCEHLLGDVADLVDAVLETGPDVHVLATSREPLGVEGEHIRLVPSLGVPPTDCDLDRAAEAAAVRLFVARGAAARDGFTLDAANVGPVVEICRHLDGLPLAIELAAARVRAMPPGEIARRLGERFRLLGGGSRRAHERHRTLYAAVSWSHDLLDGDERTVFRRLAAFPASFTLEAADDIAGGDFDTVGCVLRLVDRSLVHFDPDDGRYHLLETLRQFGADRLSEAGETDETAARHAEFYLGLAAAQAGALIGSGYPAARDVVTAELENLRAAAEWCAERDRWRDLLALCHHIHPFVVLSRPESGPWYQRLLAADPDLRGQDRADALGELAYVFAQHYADWGEGEAVARESDDLASAEGLAPSPWARMARSMVAVYSGDHEATLRFAREAAVAAKAAGDEFAAIMAVAMMADGLNPLGAQEDARRASAEALARAEQLGNPALTAIVSITAAASRAITDAEPDYADGLALLMKYANDFRSADITALWSRLLRGYCILGLRGPGATEHLVEAAKLADRLNAPHAMDMALRALALDSVAAGHLDDAARLVGYSDASLAATRVDNLMWKRVETALDEALRGHDEVGAAREEGGRLKRRDILALVADLEARLAT